MGADRTLGRTLLAELAACEQRLDGWMQDAPYSRPRVKCVPDPTFKLLPLGCVPKVLAIFLARLDANLRAVVTLCGQDMAVQAQPILRALVESTVDLRYISTNPQTLCTKWCLFEEARRYAFWMQHPEEERPSDYGLCKNRTELRLAQLDRHQPHSNGKPWRLRELTRDWDMSSLARREEAGRRAFVEESAFYGIYKLLSGSLHGGVDSVGDFVVIDGKGEFQLVRGLPGRKTVFVAWAALHCTATSLRAAERCGAEVDEELGPQWASIGIPMDDLNDAAAADFRYASISAGT